MAQCPKCRKGDTLRPVTRRKLWEKLLLGALFLRRCHCTRCGRTSLRLGNLNNPHRATEEGTPLAFLLSEEGGDFKELIRSMSQAEKELSATVSETGGQAEKPAEDSKGESRPVVSMVNRHIGG